MMILCYQNLLSAVDKASKYSNFFPQNSETPANSQFFKIHKTFADYFRVRIEFFFSLENCGLFSSADYFRVRGIFELIGYMQKMACG